MTILEEIVNYKRVFVQRDKLSQSLSELEKSDLFQRDCYSLKDNLLDTNKTGIITEFKKKSPSKGLINGTAKVEEVTQLYEKYGASALSILTDEKYFGGDKQDVINARPHVKIPILRKEFIVDEYQIVEAKSIGADVILLIAACLTPVQTKDFATIAKNLGLSVLLEVHNEQELEHVNEFVDVVGVNNRNLKTFEVSIQTSIDLFEKIPNEFVKISESGISNLQNIKTLKNVGFQGFLIGENFMKTSNPGEAFGEFVKELN